MSRSVAIMSMQRIHNYGSSLQAYALQRLLEEIDGTAQVSFVDFRPGPTLLTAEPPRLGTSNAGRAMSKVLEYTVGDARIADKLKFLNHKATYGRRYFPMMGIPKSPSYKLDVDVQVIGSDEVFNCVQSNPNVGFSPDLFGRGSPAKRLITYAASFGNTTLDRIDQAAIGEQLAGDLARFHSVSVRDRNSAEIVERLTGQSPLIHLDPTLAYDLMGKEPKIPEHRLLDEKYIVVYGYSGRFTREENAELRRYARSRDVSIVCLGGVQDCGDRFVDCNPFELLAYFRDAEAVVTDTFHGTIFALINEKPFGAVIRRTVDHGYGNSEKLSSLLDLTGVSSQCVEDMARIDGTLSGDIDYGSVSSTVLRERSRALEYLGSALEGVR